MSEQHPSGEQERSLRDFADPQAMERLRELGVEQTEFAFGIDGEKDLDGQPIDAEVFWLKLAHPDDPALPDIPGVEGKLYVPRSGGNEELILFTPGLPGGNAGRFEQRYARSFVDGGYSFFTIRHNGASLTNGKTSLEILNSARRMEIAKELGEHHLGGTREEGYGPADVVQEPLTPLLALQKRFKKIHLMGQSMGVAASYNAVTRLQAHPEVQEKLGNVVGIAGYVGGTEVDERGVWDGLKMPMPEQIDYLYEYASKVDVNIPEDRERYQREFLRVAEMNSHMQVPEHVGNVLVMTPEDPLIAEPDAGDPEAVLNYGPQSRRKLLIRDESALGDPKPHSMLWISPENLLRAVQARVSPHGPHFIKVPKSPDTGLVEKA